MTIYPTTPSPRDGPASLLESLEEPGTGMSQLEHVAAGLTNDDELKTFLLSEPRLGDVMNPISPGSGPS